jgi:UDP-N-acetylmuramate--alanine ligase
VLGDRTDAVVASTAIEEDNPDIVAARRRRIPVVHRSDVLAACVDDAQAVAVAGTSGKSSVTALCFELLSACGKEPSLIAGADLICLTDRGFIGNAFAGDSDLLVVEADESDGSLIKYHPHIALFLNVSKDHKPIAETMELFETLRGQSEVVIVNDDDPRVRELPSHGSFGSTSRAVIYPRQVDTLTPRIRATIEGTVFEFPPMGKHNLSNLLAAVAVCRQLGCSLQRLAAAAANYRGLKRRFEVVGSAGGITVIDDFAHNPAKLSAAIGTAQNMGRRVLAVFQPHGFGPTRFLKDELVETLGSVLRQQDSFYALPIYYAGGTATRDVSSEDIVGPLVSRGLRAEASTGREACIASIADSAGSGDVVLCMGARDPSLPGFAASILAAVEHESR